MLDFLKKIGIPATVAAIISAIVTITPFLFKLDERYVKESDVDARLVKAAEEMNDLTVEVGKLVGAQQVLVAVLTADAQHKEVKTEPKPMLGMATPQETPKVDLSTTLPAPAVGPASAVSRSIQLQQVQKQLGETQVKVQEMQNRKAF